MKIGLIDCNAFFCSCEMLFRPELRHRPVIVLSSNDGAVVSRTREAKQWVKMGQPYFEIASLCKAKGIEVFSSNFSLYADLSRRVKSVIGDHFTQEPYSIDESFVFLEPDMGVREARAVKREIEKLTGIPVSVGISTSKVLAKLATDRAKDVGVYEIEDIDSHLNIPVEEIWGINKGLGSRLRGVGICTAFDLKFADMTLVRKVTGVTGERIARELSGTSCLDLTDCPEPKKSITCSRSFGNSVDDVAILETALNEYVTEAAQELRAQGSICRAIEVILSTSRHREPQHHPSILIQLSTPTAHTARLISTAYAGLRKIFREGFDYKKTGVTLLGIEPAINPQSELFESNVADPKQKRLLDAVDQLNSIRKDTITFGRVKSRGHWANKHDLKSPSYTSNWNELPSVGSCNMGNEKRTGRQS